MSGNMPAGVTENDLYFNDDPDGLDEEEEDGDSENWVCAYPGRCLMPDPLHHRSECHTIADMERYYREMEGIVPE